MNGKCSFYMFAFIGLFIAGIYSFTQSETPLSEQLEKIELQDLLD